MQVVSCTLPPKHCQSKGIKHYYYFCSRRSHSAGAGCDAKYIPAEAAEEYILTEIRRLSSNTDLVAEIVHRANGNREGLLERMAGEQRSLRRRIQEVQNKIGRLTVAIESGADVQSLVDRLAELESEKMSMEDELAGFDEEMEQTRQATISAKQMTVSYRALPEILDRLEAAGDRYTIRELLHGCIEVIDWTQDKSDSSQDTVEIMVFEEQLPGSVGVAIAKETRDAQLVTSRCVTSNGRLPE